MSLKKNITANYVSQIYIALIGIIMVPVFVDYMGAEAYGLVGFYATLQIWFLLLDMGLSPTMVRETARFNGGKSNALNLRRLLRALETIFIGIALLGSITVIAVADKIAAQWLNVEQLSLNDVEISIRLMACIIGLRLVSGLYKGAINGFEQLVWLSGFNIFIATARFVLVIPVFIYIGTEPTVFFCYQLSIALLELAGLMVKTYFLLPKVDTDKPIFWQWKPIRGVLKFSMSIAVTTSVWVLATQTDKLILSNLLSLTEYAYYTLAVLMASGVMIISGPISSAIIPRLSKLSAQGNEENLVNLYRNATQLVAVISTATALVLAFFSEQVLLAWTGNPKLSEEIALVLSLYAIGNCILTLRAFTYYIQFAKGDLKLHLIGSIINILFIVPTLILATLKYGVLGAAYTWLGTNIIFFLLWVPIIHKRLVKGLHINWLLNDIIPIAMLSLTSCWVVDRLINWSENRFQLVMEITVVSVIILLISACGSSFLRDTAQIKWRAKYSDTTK